MIKGMISTLHKLEKQWDDNYYLFGSNYLFLIDRRTNEVIETFYISADGGDPAITEINGKEYINFD